MRVIIRQNVWHGGEIRPAGSLIDLSDESARRLMAIGVAESADNSGDEPEQVVAISDADEGATVAAEIPVDSKPKPKRKKK